MIRGLLVFLTGRTFKAVLVLLALSALAVFVFGLKSEVYADDHAGSTVAGTCETKDNSLLKREGEPIFVTYKLTNTGTRIWDRETDPAEAWYLGMGDPHKDSTALKGNYARILLDKTVAPGESITVTAKGFATELDPVYLHHYLVKEGEAWFESIKCPKVFVYNGSPITEPNPCAGSDKLGSHTFRFSIRSAGIAPAALTGPQKIFIRFKPVTPTSIPVFILDIYNHEYDQRVSTADQAICDYVPAGKLSSDRDGWSYMVLSVPFKQGNQYLDLHVGKAVVSEMDFLYMPYGQCDGDVLDEQFRCINKPNPIIEPSPDPANKGYFFKPILPSHEVSDEEASESSFILFNVIPVMFRSPALASFEISAAANPGVWSMLVIIGMVTVCMAIILALRHKKKHVSHGVYMVMIFAVVATGMILIVSAGTIQLLYEFESDVEVVRGGISVEEDSSASNGSKVRLK